MSQWNKREQLFALQTIPDCDLKVVQIPQTQCETDVADQQWRRNLERLNASVEAPEPDAVICAGRVPFGVGRLPR